MRRGGVPLLYVAAGPLHDETLLLAVESQTRSA